MRILTMGYFLIPFIILMCFQSLSRNAYVLTFCASLTTLAVFSIGDNYITLYLLLFVVVFVKYVCYVVGRGTIKRAVPKTLIMYFIWCAMTIPLSALPVNHSVLATGLEATDYVRFHSSQFTQLIYLLVSVVFCVIMSDLLESGVITQRNLWKSLCASYVMAVILVYVHALLPREISLLLFRNGKVDEFNLVGTICGAFFEPSTMACYICPFVCVFLERFLRDLKISNLLLSIIGFVACYLSGSSSAWFGLFFWIGFAFIRYVIRRLTVTKIRSSRLKLLAYVFLLLIVVSVIILALPLLGSELEKLGTKLSLFSDPHQPNPMNDGRGVIFWLNFRVFLHSPLIGLGFGSVRSADLTATILASTGVVGMGLYLAYWLPLLFILLRHPENDSLTTYIFVYNAVMLAAVPEPYYLTIWAMNALMYSKTLVTINEEKDNCHVKYFFVPYIME